MNRSEKLNWTIAIVGLIASLISIFAFVTGVVSVPGMMKKPEEPKAAPVVNAPAPASRTKIGLGTVTKPVIDTAHKVGRQITPRFLKPRRHSEEAVHKG